MLAAFPLAFGTPPAKGALKMGAKEGFFIQPSAIAAAYASLSRASLLDPWGSLLDPRDSLLIPRASFWSPPSSLFELFMCIFGYFSYLFYFI
mgnify:CR=1 FL=1